MRIIKETSITFLSNIIRGISTFIILKALASKLGPSGYASIGQTINLISIFTFLSGTGFTNGIIRHLSDKDIKPEIKNTIPSLAITYVLLSGSLIVLFIVIFSIDISTYVYHDPNFRKLIVFVSIASLLVTTNNILLSIITAKKDIVKLATANILGSILSTSFVLISMNQLSQTYLIYVFIASQSIIVLPTFFYAKNYIDWSSQKRNWLSMVPIVRSMMGYFTIEVITSVLGPFTLLLVRNHLISDQGSFSTGLWDGMTRISNIYYTLITAAFTPYCFPKLSESNDPLTLKNDLYEMFKIISICGISLSVLIVFFRRLVTISVLSLDFSPINEYYFIQMTGEVFRLYIWLGSLYLLSKGNLKELVYLGIIMNAFYYSIVITLTKSQGSLGVYTGTLVSNMTYALIMFFIIRKLIRDGHKPCV